MLKTIATAAALVCATTATASERVNVTAAVQESDRFVSRFQTGLTNEQEAARSAAAQRAEQQLRSVVESVETGSGDKTAGGWRWMRVNGEATPEAIKQAGGWRWMRVKGEATPEAMKLAGGWRWMR